jgi:hypothetical protein
MKVGNVHSLREIVASPVIDALNKLRAGIRIGPTGRRARTAGPSCREPQAP